MIRQFTAAAACLLCLPPSIAGDPPLQARRLAAACTACHASPPGGPGIPSLHGRPAKELEERLTAFRTGRVKATVMHQIVRAYRDDELRLIAEYFSALPRTAL